MIQLQDAKTRADRPADTPLKTRHLVILLAATHTPLGLMWGAVPQAYQYGQVESMPLVFAFIGLVSLAFVLGYSGLAKRVRHPGGLYVQIAHGLGRPAGLGAAAVLVVAYTGLIANLYSFFSLVFVSVLDSLTGIKLPVWAGIVICVAVVALLGRLRLKQMTPVLTIVIGLQIVVVLVCVVEAFRSPAGGHVSLQSLEPGGLLTGSFAAALVYAIIASVGTEVSASYTDELEDPQHSLPRATYLSYAITTTVMIVSAVGLSVVAGPENLPVLADKAGLALMPMLLAQIAGAKAAVAVLNVLLSVLLIGIIGGALALQNALRRQLSGLARDGVLPHRFKSRAAGDPPQFSLFVAQPVVAGGLAIFGTRLEGQILPLWFQIASALAITSMLTLASLGTVSWFLRGEDDESGFMGWEGQVVAAAFAAVTTGLIFTYGITHVSKVAPGSAEAAKWLVAALIFGPFLIGGLVALWLRAARPKIYAMIGRSTAEPAEPRPHAPSYPPSVDPARWIAPAQQVSQPQPRRPQEQDTTEWWSAR